MRRRLSVLALVALAGALIPVTVLFYVVLSRSLESDASAVLHDRAAAASQTAADAHPGRDIAEPADEAVLDNTTWIFDASGAMLEQPAGPKDDTAAAVSLAHVTRPVRLDTEDLALLALPVRAEDGRRLGTVVAGVSRLPFERAERTALTAALALDLLVLLGGVVLTWRTVSATLAPVARMTTAASEWGSHDVHRRFALGPATDEITGLAATLDGLLGRLETSLGHEQRLTAEIAHELRTPLARIRADAEVALRAAHREDTVSTGQTHNAAGVLTEALENVVTDVDDLSRVIDALLRTAESHPPAQGQSTVLETALQDACAQVGLDPRTTTGLHSAHGATVPVEQDLVTRCLVPVLSNAVVYGKGAVGIDVRTEGAEVVVEISDDGPGFTVDDLDTVLGPGVRGSAAVGRPGAGLGLSLALRLARSAGGDLTLLPVDGPRQQGTADSSPMLPGGRVQLRFRSVPETLTR